MGERYVSTMAEDPVRRVHAFRAGARQEDKNETVYL